MAAKRQMSYLFETYHLYPPSLALSTCLKSEVCQLYVLTAINTLQKNYAIKKLGIQQACYYIKT